MTKTEIDFCDFELRMMCVCVREREREREIEREIGRMSAHERGRENGCCESERESVYD